MQLLGIVALWVAVMLHAVQAKLGERRELVVGGKSWNVAYTKRYWAAIKSPTSNQPLCAGILVSDQWVLTTARCATMETRLDLTIGSPYWATIWQGGSIRKTRRKVIHPRYNATSYENDIALLLLDSKLSYIYSPVLLKRFGGWSDTVQSAAVQGWGWTKPTNGEMQPNRFEANVPLVSYQTCTGKLAYSPDRVFEETNICAGRAAGGVGPCEGDLGAPLVHFNNTNSDMDDVLIGLYSWSDGCGARNKYGVYTRVEPYIPWILSQISSGTRLEPQLMA